MRPPDSSWDPMATQSTTVSSPRAGMALVPHSVPTITAVLPSSTQMVIPTVPVVSTSVPREEMVVPLGVQSIVVPPVANIPRIAPHVTLAEPQEELWCKEVPPNFSPLFENKFEIAPSAPQRPPPFKPLPQTQVSSQASQQHRVRNGLPEFSMDRWIEGSTPAPRTWGRPPNSTVVPVGRSYSPPTSRPIGNMQMASIPRPREMSVSRLPRSISPRRFESVESSSAISRTSGLRDPEIRLDGTWNPVVRGPGLQGHRGISQNSPSAQYGMARSGTPYQSGAPMRGTPVQTRPLNSAEAAGRTGNVLQRASSPNFSPRGSPIMRGRSISVSRNAGTLSSAAAPLPADRIRSTSRDVHSVSVARDRIRRVDGSYATSRSDHYSSSQYERTSELTPGVVADHRIQKAERAERSISVPPDRLRSSHDSTPALSAGSPVRPSTGAFDTTTTINGVGHSSVARPFASQGQLDDNTQQKAPEHKNETFESGTAPQSQSILDRVESLLGFG